MLKFYRFSPTIIRTLEVLLSWQETKLIQYADDATFILDGSKNSSEEAVRIFLNVFKLSSGLSINLEKYNLFPLGQYIHRQPAFTKSIAINLLFGPLTMLGTTLLKMVTIFFS